MRLILDYVLDEVIGAGTETVVHRARQLPSGRSVAIKVAADHLRGSALAAVDARLRGEARQLERLDHPAIVPLVEFIDGGLDPGAGGAPVALVYALAEDGTVADLVDRADASAHDAVGAGPLTSETVARWRADLVDGLATAHACGIVHGDLSTSALLLSGDRIWVSGFGSTAAATATPEDDLTSLDQLLAALAPPDRTAPRSTPPGAGEPAPQGAGPPPRLLPRPPAPDRDRRPLVIGGVAIGAVALLAGIAALWLTAGGSPRSAASASTVTTMTGSETVPAKPPCPGTGSAIPAGAVAVVGDPTGTGCTVTMVWWPERAEAERPEGSGARSRFLLGDPGDQLVLGDWDGDGVDTPALYDPGRGEVVRFDRWAEPGETVEGAVDPVPVPGGGLAGVVRRSGGDDVEVRPAPAP